MLQAFCLIRAMVSEMTPLWRRRQSGDKSLLEFRLLGHIFKPNWLETCEIVIIFLVEFSLCCIRMIEVVRDYLTLLLF
jgi:hypothetical protein